MKLYYVDLERTQVLDRREVRANSPEEAKEKALLTFNKFDLDDYDNVRVDLAPEVEE